MSYRQLNRVVPWIVTPGLLVFLWFRVDGAQALARLDNLQAGWLVAGLFLASLQVVLSALRWRLTARQVGAPMARAWSVREYYLGSFLNQLLPGGVAGDVFRAWRHRRKNEQGQGDLRFFPALRIVMIERGAGYLILLPFAAAGAFLWMPAPWNLLACALLLGALAVLVIAPFYGERLPFFRALKTFLLELRDGLLARSVVTRQLLLSFLIFTTYVLVFACSAHALQIPIAPLFLFTAVPLLLLSMVLPFTIAGWGVREAAAVGLWGLSGYAVEDGLAISVGYGLLILLGALPGALVLIFDRR